MSVKSYPAKVTTDASTPEDLGITTYMRTLLLMASESAFKVLANLAGLADVQTLTNKRITPRVTTEVSNATPSINSDVVDMHSLTAMAAAITGITVTGTPTDGQQLKIKYLDDGTGRAITHGAQFEDRGTALTATTTASKLLTETFEYDIVAAIWGCVHVADET